MELEFTFYEIITEMLRVLDYGLSFCTNIFFMGYTDVIDLIFGDMIVYDTLIYNAEVYVMMPRIPIIGDLLAEGLSLLIGFFADWFEIYTFGFLMMIVLFFGFLIISIIHWIVKLFT